MRRIFGYPGGDTNDMFGALQRAGDKIESVQMRYEKMVTFMASARVKFTGEFGMCMVMSGPGAARLITGLYDVRLDHMPVLAIIGQQTRIAVDGHYQQKVGLAAMFRDVIGAFVHQVSMPARAQYLLGRAVRIAIGQRRMTALILLNDLQEIFYTKPPHAYGTVHSGVDYNAPSVIPQAVGLERAVDTLNSGHRMAMLVGAGVLGASAEMAAVAETLGAGVARTLLGKAVLSDDLPYVTGAIGLLGTELGRELMDHCDTLLMVSPGFPYAELLPREGQAHGVQIDLDPGMLGLRYPMEVNLTGDSAQTLRTLLPLLQHKTDPC